VVVLSSVLSLLLSQICYFGGIAVVLWPARPGGKGPAVPLAAGLGFCSLPRTTRGLFRDIGEVGMRGEWSLEEGVRSCYWATMGGMVEESSETVRFDVCFGGGALHCIAGRCRLGVRLLWK
jgi:hypothetical protein